MLPGFLLVFGMTLLDVITKAAADHEPVPVGCYPKFPVILNTDNIFLNLKPAVENIDPASLVRPVIGWEPSLLELQIIGYGNKFYSKLNRRHKNIHNFNKDEFIGMLNAYFEKIRKKVRISPGDEFSGNECPRILIQKVGLLMGRYLAGLVMEVCIHFEVWDFVETLIVVGLVDFSFFSKLARSLMTKKKSDVLCLSIRHASDIGSSELFCILKYFLSPSKQAYDSMLSVRKDWENQSLLAINKVSNKSLGGKNLCIAKKAAILLMLAHDGFSTLELCLHYLLASRNIDEALLSLSLSKLNGKEVMFLIRYLNKWLTKYEMFPEAGLCAVGSSMFCFKACDWVPMLEDIVRWLNLLLDEHFCFLVLHPQFHEELKSIHGRTASLALEGRHGSFVVNIIENLIAEVKQRQD